MKEETAAMAQGFELTKGSEARQEDIMVVARHCGLDLAGGRLRVFTAPRLFVLIPGIEKDVGGFVRRRPLMFAQTHLRCCCSW